MVQRVRALICSWHDRSFGLALAGYVFLLMIGLAGCGSIVEQGTFNGHAMEHTFYDGDYIFIRTVDVAQIERGDIIAFRFSEQGNFVRRVIALPGETIEIEAGQIFVDSELLSEPYTESLPESLAPLRLESDQYFVLGDNRQEGLDSADFGPVLADQIFGRVAEPRAWE